MKIQTNNETGDIVLYPATEPRNRPGHTIREVDLPEVPKGKRLMWDNETDDFAFVDLPPKPLRLRIKKKEADITPEILASLPFERVAYWLERNRPDIARIVIEQADVTGRSKAAKDAKAALLAEFNI